MKNVNCKKNNIFTNPAEKREPIVPIEYERPKATESIPIEFDNSKEERAKAIMMLGTNPNILQNVSTNQNLTDPIIWASDTEETPAIDISSDIVGDNQDVSKEKLESRTVIDLMEYFWGNRNDNYATTETKGVQPTALTCTRFEETEIPTTNPQHLKQNFGGKISPNKKMPVPEPQSEQYISICRKNKPTPYESAQKFMQIVHLIILGSNLHMYNRCYYERVSPEKMKRIIADICREDYEEFGTARFLNEVYNVIVAEEKLVKTEKDVSHWTISFENGILDLITGRLLPHSPQYIITYGIQCSYIDGQCPNFEHFICMAMGGNADLIERTLQMIGYILSPDMNGKVLFVLQGCPHSGKSLLSELLRLFFNKEAAISLDVHELIERFSVSNLEGKALGISPDLPSTSLDAKAVSKLKQLTGNDYISADVKYQDRKEFFCHAKFVLSTNHPFVTRQPDEAFVERVVAIPFLFSVPKECQDHNLLEKMKAEMGAIAFKAIQAYYRLVRNNYQFAGNYQLNSAPALYQQGSGNMTDLVTATYSFVMNCFEEDKQGIVFIEDAHKAFVQQYCIMVANTIFSRHFTVAAQQTFHVSKGRKRKISGQNAQSCICGIRFKQE